MGKVNVVGGNPNMNVPVTGILARDLSVGSSVYLMENGVAVEYLVVNQGIPSNSSLYDSSCNGTWLLRKESYAQGIKWHSSSANKYGSATIHTTYLNSTFFNVLGEIERTAIKDVKIPYVSSYGSTGTVASGTNGLSTKVFLLAAREVGWTSSLNTGTLTPAVDGATLSYFSNVTAAKLKATYNGAESKWWLRTPHYDDTQNVVFVNQDGKFASAGASRTDRDVRPALVLPSTAVFDEETLILKGVA